MLVIKLGCAVAEYFFKDFKYKWLGREFEINIPKEIDFRNEAKNAERIAELFKDDIRIAVPKIHWEYTKESVVVMSYEEGKSITNMNYIRQNKISLRDIANILTDAFNRQIFEFGFVHSDPHPGNLFVRKEKINGKEMTRLVLLDHGLYRDLDDSFRYNYCLLWRGLITQNKAIIRESCMALGVKQVELFVSVLTSNTYDSIMSKDNRYNSYKQLGLKSNYSFIFRIEGRNNETAKIC